MASPGQNAATNYTLPPTRGYQQEMLDESLRKNIVIALDTGSGKTHIAVLRMKIEAERESQKISWFLAPTVALCEQQQRVISLALPVPVGLISGSTEPEQWKDSVLWRRILNEHRVVVSTPQVLLDALRHAYIGLGRDINLLVFDEAHHAVRDDPYNMIMKEFYFPLPPRSCNMNESLTIPVRPMILGLTASPIFGGGTSVEDQFRVIEANLDSAIISSKSNRDELTRFVNKPILKHAFYAAPDYAANAGSFNFSSLRSVIDEMDIEDDPFVQSLREKLSKLPVGSPDWKRTDQTLSKTIKKKSSYTHKGLREFSNAAEAIYWDLGPWAADWYVDEVLRKARAFASPYDAIVSQWQNKEKAYLLEHLAKIETIPVSYRPEDIIVGTSDKVRLLVECLQAESTSLESDEDPYRGLVFVTRRDTVLALSELLVHHPGTSGLFTIGRLLGASESAYRRSFLDITRRLLNRSQHDTLTDFDMGEMNLLIATSVAEEGIDIQACGSVIRFDIPANMVSWAQSRGRARRKKSTFTVLFEDSGIDKASISRWQQLEREMSDMYNSREVEFPTAYTSEDEDEENVKFCVESTGALVTLESVVSHISHFCAVLPNASHVSHLPIYEIDPLEFPEGWHAFNNKEKKELVSYTGPFGCTLTLPRLLPPDLRVFTVECKYPTKRSACRHAAFKAYIGLYKAGLLNDNLLPLSSVVEPDLEDEVRALLSDVEKRPGTMGVTVQIDPWAPTDPTDGWWTTEVIAGDLPPLLLLTRIKIESLQPSEMPMLYRPNHEPTKVAIRSCAERTISPEILHEARQYTRRLFWAIYGPRMEWDNLDFAYLFLPPQHPDEVKWDLRRSWNKDCGNTTPSTIFYANSQVFGKDFSHPDDLIIIRDRNRPKMYKFVRWNFSPIPEEEEKKMRERYTQFPELEIKLPLLSVEPFPRRMNFLIPLNSQAVPPSTKDTSLPVFLLPQYSTVDLFSGVDIDYALFLPSILRYLAMFITASSLRADLLAGSLLATAPLNLILTAITAPVSQERTNYQRLETLGDCVLKFCASINLLAEYPLWHEGYLSHKKDHSVSNVRLAKSSHNKCLYRWIIRDHFLAKKWKPAYFSTPTHPGAEGSNAPPRSDKSKQELSTKVMADVVESLLGASYIYGGFDLAVDLAQKFGLGIVWRKIPLRIEQLLSRVEKMDKVPTQITNVETIIGYTFERKLLLIEALTHASYHVDLHTVSYERLEFLGDSVLDMVVTEYLYLALSKNYSPGHMHLRKSAVVNAHFLAYICMRSSMEVGTSIPERNKKGNFSPVLKKQDIHLWQCLLHSSHRILEDQSLTFSRYQRGRDEIEKALFHGEIFPWAALTRLQAPKFFSDMMESIIGAVFLDCRGNLDVIRQLLRRLGILPILERIVQDGVDILHPVSRLSIWAGQKQKKIDYEFEKEGRKITCIIHVDEVEEVRVTTNWRGRASQEEIKFAAAEKVIRKLHLRNLDLDIPVEDEDEEELLVKENQEVEDYPSDLDEDPYN